MRSGLSALLCATLLHFALSEHHKGGHHKHKRQPVVTEDVNVHYARQDIIVYVDANNKPMSTTTVYRDQKGAPQTSQKPPSTSAAAGGGQSQPATPLDLGDKPVSAPKPPKNPEAEPESTSPKDDGDKSTDAGTGPSKGGPGFSSGVTYTPYNSDHTCKTESQVAQDLNNIQSYQVVRLYGTDCDQVAKVLKVTKGKVSIFAGVFDIDNIQKEVETLDSAVKGNWKLINTVSVGNELVNSRSKSVGQVISAIAAARSALKQKGYNGPVVTVDTMTAMKENPELCRASDFCAINCHAFFDGNVLPSEAGPFVADWAKKVSKAAGGKTTVVTESGWPTQGKANNKAIPGQSQQQQAMQSLRSSFPQNLIMFGLYNDLWKSDRADTHGAEKFWGLKGNAPS